MAKSPEQAPTTLELTWRLAELPTSQHRAGLAGLVLMLRWLDRQTDRGVGVCELVHCDAKQASLRVDRPGMQRLFDWLYAAAAEEKRYAQPFKHKESGAISEPLRTETEEVTAPKTGKVSTKTWYVYPMNVPNGGPVVDWRQATRIQTRAG